MALSVVAIASGCVTTQWVPLTQAPPEGDRFDLKVQSDSTSTALRKMTLYYPRMEGDSVLVGMAVPYDTVMHPQVRIPASSALVRIRHVNTGRTLFLLAGVGIVTAVIVAAATFSCCSYGFSGSSW